MSGTDTAYAVLPGITLRTRYAIPGRSVCASAVRWPVLIWRMPLRQVGSAKRMDKAMLPYIVQSANHGTCSVPRDIVQRTKR
eukprot:1889399-Rhodomonas_salina.2